MPRTEVVFFDDGHRHAPVLGWLEGCPGTARANCTDRIEKLREHGYQIAPQWGENLGDGMYYLRAKVRRVNYRIFYIFHDRKAVLLHGCTKEGRPDASDLARADERAALYRSDPAKHTYRG